MKNDAQVFVRILEGSVRVTIAPTRDGVVGAPLAREFPLEKRTPQDVAAWIASAIGQGPPNESLSGRVVTRPESQTQRKD